MPASFDESWGSFFAGDLFRGILLGITTVQTGLYFSKFWRDPLWLRVYVLLLFLAEICGSTFSFFSVWLYLGRHWGNLVFNVSANWTIAATTIFHVLITFMAHLFWVRRAWMLGRSYWPFAIIGLVMAFVAAGFGFLIVNLLLDLDTLLKLGTGDLQWKAICWLIPTAVADIVLTIPVVWFLVLSRNRNKQSSTDRILNSIIIWVINTGAITAAIATVIVILLLVNPSNFIYLGLANILAGLYSVSTIAFLTRREKFRTSMKRVHYVDWGESIALQHLSTATGTDAARTKFDGSDGESRKQESSFKAKGKAKVIAPTPRGLPAVLPLTSGASTSTRYETE